MSDVGDEMGAMGSILRVRMGKASWVLIPMAGAEEREIVWSILL